MGLRRQALRERNSRLGPYNGNNGNNGTNAQAHRGSRTRVTELTNTLRYRFSWEAGTAWGMRSLLSETHFGRRLSFRLLLAGFSLLAFTPSLLADTPALLRGTPTAGCYCHCAESKQHGGCIKMCESKKYASRWWAKSCAKPHMSTPKRDSHAGPRFPHPRRSEHAEL